MPKWLYLIGMHAVFRPFAHHRIPLDSIAVRSFLSCINTHVIYSRPRLHRLRSQALAQAWKIEEHEYSMTRSLQENPHRNS